MKIVVEKLTDVCLLHEAQQFTTSLDKKMNCSLFDAYSWGHSTIRTQLFIVRMYDIPTFVSVHFCRHNLGISHYVKTNRDDIVEVEGVNRDTPVNHMMVLNAESLMNLSHKRLCTKSHLSTRKVMSLIVEEVRKVDEDLANFLVPQCVYRNGVCSEPNSCSGRFK